MDVQQGEDEGHADVDAVLDLAEIGRAGVLVDLDGDLVDARQGVQDVHVVLSPAHDPGCQDIEILFRPYGFIPKFTAVPNISTVFANVENGLGVAVLDGWYQGIHHPGIHYMTLNDELPISIAWHRSTIAPSIDKLYEKLKNHFK